MDKTFYDDKTRYRVRFTSQALGESEQKQTPFLALQFDVIAVYVGPEETEPVVSKQRTAYLYITDKTIERFRDDLETLGFDRDSFKYLDPKTPGFFDFAGREGDMYCQHQEYNGDKSERWGVAGKPRGLSVQELDAKGIRSLDSLFGKALKGLAKAPAPKPVAVKGQVDDGDVPF